MTISVFAAAILASAVQGTLSEDGKSWAAKGVPHEQGALYAISYRATAHGAGVLTGGAKNYNMDFTVKAGQTNEALRTYIYPAEAKYVDLRLGTWEMKGGASWCDVRTVRVNPVYNKLKGELELGAGEAIDGNVYRFYRRSFDVQGPHVRTFLKRNGAKFNSNRWCVYGESGCEFLFELKGRRFLDFEVTLPVVHYSKGSVTVSVSRDGENWHDVVTCGKRDHFTGCAPAGLFPADSIFVRTKGSAGTSLQTGFPRVVARIDGDPMRAAGFTRYFEAKSGRMVAEIGASDYYNEDWGERIDVWTKGFTLWGAEEEMRIAPWRKVPSRRTSGLSVSAAANEAEAVQLVMKAGARDVRGVKVFARDDFVSRSGAKIPASAFDVRQVTYLDIKDISDRTSAPGLWPEPLEPLPTGGVDVPAGENRSFWVRVKVPKGTPGGIYAGRLHVHSKGAKPVAVPFEVEVFGFELPDRMTLQTSFGYTQGRVFAYHGVKNAAERREVNAHYLKALSEAHLSPYNPGTGLVASQWKYRIDAKEGDEANATITFEWAQWDAGMRKVLDEYNFNTFIFSIPGFSSKAFPKNGEAHVFHGRKEGTPGYDALVSKYLGAIEAHLREKGWLDVAYLYWYDEPTADKFPWLDRGLATVGRYAPAIRRMITKEPCAGLYKGVNLWCPTPDHLETSFTQKCRARGDEFWWYVCMQPKAPYATEFIDHPGTDLRVWLWQTWQHRVSGILIWETVYWSSPTIYGNELQNPYEDAASWSDMGTGPKTFRYNWGNGDGRFLYPPRSCFATDRNGPVVEAPNGTMRLEILRDGIEDYEYFAMLSRLDPKNPLLKVPESVSESLTRFTIRPEPIKEHRRRLAKEIERLGGLKR